MSLGGSNNELACVYAALILNDEGLEISSDNIAKILKASPLSRESPRMLRVGRPVLAILHNAQPCSAMALAQRSAITQAASRGQAGGSRHRSTTAYEIDPSRVTITQGADGVAEVRLSRPDKMNALDLPMFRSIAAAARRLLADRSVRAVVLHGEGRAFCAGLDVKSVAVSLQAQANLKELLDRPEGEISNLAQDVGYLWRRVPAPVIAATHGVCLGGGFQIALGADLRVATPACRFSVMEAKWGLIPDMSATVSLRERVPRDVALELVLTGRVFDAAEAVRLGLVTRIAEDPLEEARRLAREISTRSPDATAAAKRLTHATHTEACEEARALHLETALQRRLLGGWNQVAISAKGLGAPPLLVPGFRRRSALWDAEADTEAEAELRAMLDGEELDFDPAADVAGVDAAAAASAAAPRSAA